MAQGDGSHLKVSGCMDVCVNIFVVYFNLKKTSLDEDFAVKGVLCEILATTRMDSGMNCRIRLIVSVHGKTWMESELCRSHASLYVQVISAYICDAHSSPHCTCKVGPVGGLTVRKTSWSSQASVFFWTSWGGLLLGSVHLQVPPGSGLCWFRHCGLFLTSWPSFKLWGE